MRFTAPTKEFKLALDRLSLIPGSTGSFPIIKLVVDSFEGMTITRVTPEASLTIVVPGIEVLVDGEAEVNLASFAGLIGQAPGAHIEVNHEKPETLDYVIRSNKSRYVCRGLDPGSAPHPPNFDGKHIELTVPTAEFLRLLDTAAAFASKNTTDPQMMGVCLRSTEGFIDIIATDRNSLVSLDSGLQLEKGQIDVLLPEEACRALCSAFKGESAAESTFRVFNNGIQFLNATGSLTTVVSELNLPNIAHLIEKLKSGTPNSAFSCERAELLKALKRAAYAGQGDKRAVVLDIDKQALTIRADDNCDKEIDEEVDGRGTAKLIQKISASRLIAILEKCLQEEVTIEIRNSDGNAAATIEESDRFFFLGIMV